MLTDIQKDALTATLADANKTLILDLYEVSAAKAAPSQEVQVALFSAIGLLFSKVDRVDQSHAVNIGQADLFPIGTQFEPEV